MTEEGANEELFSIIIVSDFPNLTFPYLE
jgi:hypothetical protein